MVEVKSVKSLLKVERRENASLRKKVKTLSSSKYQGTIIKNALMDNFTAPQSKIILGKKKQPRMWTQEDIVDGLVLRSFSKRSYQYLRKKDLLPLPGLTTLRRWVKNFTCYPGIQEDVLKVLSSKLSGVLPENFRHAILSFDEMTIKNCYEYHHGQDKVYGPHKKVQLVILRGLFHKWKIPIFYSFDTTMTKKLLLEIVLAVEEHNAIVRGAAGDLGNQKVISELGLTEDQPWFLSPLDETRKIYFFPDAPHLLKLLRNHLLDQGLHWDDGTTLEKKDLILILDKDHGETKIHHKLTPEHLNCQQNARQRVRLAAQLLSHTTSKALMTLCPAKTKSAKFIKLVDSW